MPDNKLQHYVPRAHLRPFTWEGAGKSVDLFHIASGKLIRGAEAKGQCAKDYFYGDDLIIEKALQEPEGHYARIVRDIEAGAALPARDFQALLVFFLLQSFRSFGQVERTISMGKLMTSDLRNAGAEEVPEFLEDWQQAVQFLLRTALDIGVDGHVEGLRLVIGKAPTGKKFVTSDDPAIHVNRYHSQRLGEKSFGFGNTGLMFFLPLTPDYVFIAFDPDCYSCAGGYTINLSAADVLAINHLQMLFARKTIYLPRDIDDGTLLSSFDLAKEHRPTSWMIRRFLVEDPEVPNRFVPVDEMPKTGSFMQHMEMVKPTPVLWPKALPFRMKVRTNRTGTGAGDVRPNYNAERIRINKAARQLGMNVRLV